MKPPKTALIPATPNIWPQGYKTFFVLVLHTRSLCSTEYDTKHRGYTSFGVRSLLSWIWSTYINIKTYGVVRDCCKNAGIYRITKSNSHSIYISL